MAWGQLLEGRIVHWTRLSVDQTLFFLFLIFEYSFGESLRRHAPVEPVSAGEPGAGPRAGKPKLATRL